MKDLSNPTPDGQGLPDRCRAGRPRPADAAGAAADPDAPMWWCMTGWSAPRSWRWCPTACGGSTSASCRNATRCRKTRSTRCWSSLAQEGLVVARLKGGDPLIFGRGSEEARTCARAGVAVDYVPGITAAQGAPPSTGVPLTHRGLATGVRYVTGHRAQDAALDLDWASLACERDHAGGLHGRCQHRRDRAAADAARDARRSAGAGGFGGHHTARDAPGLHARRDRRRCGAGAARRRRCCS